MSTTPEYLKQPNHVEGANQFINQVGTTIAHKYFDLDIAVYSLQAEAMDIYDEVLKAGPTHRVIKKILKNDPQFVEKSRESSYEAEIKAVDQIVVAVHLSGNDTQRMEGAISQIDELALFLKGEKDPRFGELEDRKPFEELYGFSWGSANYYIFRR